MCGYFSVKAAIITKIAPCFNNLVTKANLASLLARYQALAYALLGVKQEGLSMSIKSKLSNSCVKEGTFCGSLQFYQLLQTMNLEAI